MKTANIILILLACVIVFFTACKLNMPSTTTELIVMRDVTENQLAVLSAEEIYLLTHLTDKWNGATVVFTDLTDVSLNNVKEINIAPANNWLSNEPERDREVAKFKTQLFLLVSSFQQDTVGRSHSSIYLPIARELNKLSKSNADKKILVIYSDLMENEPDFSFYSKEKFQLLKTNPDSVENIFSHEQPLNSLSGIEVHFVFQPKDAFADAQYKLVFAFYKNMLEKHGATVYLGANLTD